MLHLYTYVVSLQQPWFECWQAGIIEEMLEDTFESVEDDDLEEVAQEEVDKILFEVTKGIGAKNNVVLAFDVSEIE